MKKLLYEVHVNRSDEVEIFKFNSLEESKAFELGLSEVQKHSPDLQISFHVPAIISTIENSWLQSSRALLVFSFIVGLWSAIGWWAISVSAAIDVCALMGLCSLLVTYLSLLFYRKFSKIK